MATVTAASIINRASVVLHDQAKQRWSESELLSWLNIGQREIVLQRPEAYAVNREVTTVSGAKQTIPADAVRLIDVARNVGGRAVTLTTKDMLDAEDPSWMYGTATASAIHYCYDQRDPRTFYVYPPSTGATGLEVVVSAAPADVSTAGNVISIDDIYANTLLDYVLFRAFSKDSGSTTMKARAEGHYMAFANSLGLKQTADTMSNPNLNVVPTQQVPTEVLLK